MSDRHVARRLERFYETRNALANATIEPERIFRSRQHYEADHLLYMALVHHENGRRSTTIDYEGKRVHLSINEHGSVIIHHEE